MESSGTALSCTRAALLLLHLGLTSSMAQKNEFQTGLVGGEVTLNCTGILPESQLPRDSVVRWKYSDTLLWRMENNLGYWRKPSFIAGRSDIKMQYKQLSVRDLKLSDAGIYTCEYGTHKVHTSLHIVNLEISLDGHFLQNEVAKLILTQNSSSPLPDLSITLFDNNNNRVTPEIQKKNLQEYIVNLKKLETMDSGTWVCQIHSDSPLINQNISFPVKVLGFQNPDLERKYATVDSAVILSWRLNSQKIKWKKGFTGQINWKQQEGAESHVLLDFDITAEQLHETKKSNNLLFEIPESKPESHIEVKLPKVHFNHSGQYQCQLEYERRHAQSKIELVVMKVSANPAGPLSRGASVTLTCQVSGPLAPDAYLSWEPVNGSKMDIKKSKQREVKLEVTISTAGLWSCDLIEGSDKKISFRYHVEEASVWIINVIIGASIGGSLLAFALGCLCIISGVRWQRRRQRAKRMAQARQHLLENKTCQCQHRLRK